MTVKQTAGRDALGAFAPKFAELNDDVLFGQVWNRTAELSLRDRSLVTVVALMAQGLTDSSFTYHLESAKKNGITRTEIAEVLTHAAFYAGWPKAWAAFRMAKEVWGDGEGPTEGTAQTPGSATAAEAAGSPTPVAATDPTDPNATLDQFAATLMFPVGEPNDAYAPYFSGRSWLAPLTGAQVPTSNVTFEPGCRNNWHIHHAEQDGGQMLVCVGGRGYYQEWGQPAIEMRPGDVVNIPAGVKHWHGAAANSWFAHLALTVPGEGCANEWLEPVSDEQYASLA